MTTTARTRSLLSSGRRVVGALSAGAAVAVVGIGAVPAGTAAAAGLHRAHLHVAPAPAVDPACCDPCADADRGGLLDRLRAKMCGKKKSECCDPCATYAAPVVAGATAGCCN